MLLQEGQRVILTEVGKAVVHRRPKHADGTPKSDTGVVAVTQRKETKSILVRLDSAPDAKTPISTSRMYWELLAD